ADSTQAPEQTSAALSRDDTVSVRDALITPRRDSEPEPAIGSSEPQIPAGPSRLKIRFREESWVEIFDADGIRREFRLARPGSSISVGGTPPFNVLLGYAEGATVVFDGEVHDIRPHIRGDTARFQIGPEGSKRIRAPRPREEPTTSTAEASDAAAASNPAENEVTGSN
ncbi:MAG: DUF4115 domain-containing protein, partial [Gammaproteobacteria bacterium]|nr:DUF4115 domain-containing protein [Gammaproteobacteria bacterium]